MMQNNNNEIANQEQNKKDKKQQSESSDSSSSSDENSSIQEKSVGAASMPGLFDETLGLRPIQLVSAKEIKSLTVLTYKNILACENYIRSINANQQTLPIVSWMSSHIQFIISQTLETANITGHEDWKNKPYLEWLFPTLKQVFPEHATVSTSIGDRIAALHSIFMKVNIENPTTAHEVVEKLRDILSLPAFAALNKKEVSAIITKLYGHMKSQDRANPTADRLRELVQATAPKTFEDFIKTYLRQYNWGHSMVLNAKPFLAQIKPKFNTNQNSNNGTSGNKPAKSNNYSKKTTTSNSSNNTNESGRGSGGSSRSMDQQRAECYGCGRTHNGVCTLSNHPDFNRESLPWKDSAKGKAWANRIDPKTNAPTEFLPWFTTLSGTPWNAPEIKLGRNPKRDMAHNESSQSKKRKSSSTIDKKNDK